MMILYLLFFLFFDSSITQTIPSVFKDCANSPLVVTEWVKYTFEDTSGQDCTITIISSEPKAFISLKIFAYNFADDEEIEFYNDVGVIMKKEPEEGKIRNLAYWPPAAVYAKIKTNIVTNATLEFQVDIYTMNVRGTEHLNVRENSPLVVDMTSMNNSYKYVYTSNSKIVLWTINYPDTYTLARWMNLFIYDGVGEDAPLVSTAYSTINDNYVVSSGNSLTIFCASSSYNFGRLIVSDYNDVKSFGEMRSSWSHPVTSNDQMLSMDASKGPAVLTAMNSHFGSPMIIKHISFSDTDSSLVLYSGPPRLSPNTVLATYNANGFCHQLAQQLPEMTTFQLDKGQATINTTIKDKYTNWNEATAGRKGFLATPQYGFESLRNNIREFYMKPESTDSTYNYTFKVVKGMSDPTAYGYVIATTEGAVTNYSFPAGVVTSDSLLSLSIIAQSVNLSIFGGNSENTGALIEFEVSTGFSHGCVLVMVSVLMLCIY